MGVCLKANDVVEDPVRRGLAEGIVHGIAPSEGARATIFYPTARMLVRRAT